MAMVIQQRQHYRVSQRDYKKIVLLFNCRRQLKERMREIEGGYGACEETRDCCTC